VELVEKLVANEVKQREATVNTQLKEAKEKVKAGDNAGAIPLLKSVAEQQCMFPKKAKDAAKELKKLQWIKIEPRWDSLRSDPTLPRLDAAHRTSPVMRLGRLR
jgi:hypothetical protein